MDKHYFFNTSLPRSGSTLFQNIIGQNPDFYVTPTSGFLELIYGAKSNFQSCPEFKAQDAEQMKKAFLGFCRTSMDGYFNALTDKKYVLDKNRGWAILHALVKEFYDKPKMVCLVRDPRAIFSSMEKKFRKNPIHEHSVQNATQLIGTTVAKRVEIWASGLPVGLSLDRLKDTIEQGIAEKMLFIRYEDLMDNPALEIKRFYDYIGQNTFNHDFEKITQITQENDRFHDIYGDHIIREKLEPFPKDYEDILGFETCQSIKKSYKWFYDYFNYI